MNQAHVKNRTFILVSLGVLGLGLIVLLILGIFVFRSNIRGVLSSTKDIVLSVVDRKNVAKYNKGDYTDIIFLHHSVGQNLIHQGNVRQNFVAQGYNFWDHDYNWPGLTDPEGNQKGYSYAVPDDNTDIAGLNRIFNQKVYSLPVNTLSGLLQHEVIIFKSCYPNNAISSEEQLAQDREYYSDIGRVIDAHPDKLFILVTTPPLTPAETNQEEAIRASKLAAWLSSDEFKKDHANLYVFDLYSNLAEKDTQSPNFGMLRQEFQNGTDSHPNREANELMGPMFVNFVIESINQFRSN
jgi:hypothetical protein